MENAVKALEMAAGVMLGVILMALVAYFFTSISSWPQNEEDIMSTEQLKKFNLEYEVYNKSKMYGVDVISCLNKVISNNEKYAQGGAFLEGNASLGDYKQRENYWINIRIKLGKNSTSTELTLKENIKTMYIDTDNREKERFSKDNEITLPRTAKGLEKLNSAINKVGDFTTLGDKINDFSYSQENDEVPIFSDTTYIIDGYVNLIYRKPDGNVSDMNKEIQRLLNSIQSLNGGQGTGNLTFTLRNTTGKDYREWTQIVWETVLYDLKNRKFTCTDLDYNIETGRVNEIAFEEI